MSTCVFRTDKIREPNFPPLHSWMILSNKPGVWEGLDGLMYILGIVGGCNFLALFVFWECEGDLPF